MSHSIMMQGMNNQASFFLGCEGETINSVRKYLRSQFPMLPENAITKTLALARFKTEENYKNVKRFQRGISNRNAISKSKGGLP